MSSFFTKPSSQRKRKRTETTKAPSRKHSKPQSKDEARIRAREEGDEESISSNDSGHEEGEFFTAAEEQSGSDSAAEDETAAERRLRLAERYLQNIQDEVEETIGFDAAEIDRDLIAERLKEDEAETKGKMYRHVAGDLDLEGASRSFFTADQNGTTGIATCAPFAYTVARDGTVVKWEIPLPPSQQEEGDVSTVKRENTNTTPRRKPNSSHPTAPILAAVPILPILVPHRRFYASLPPHQESSLLPVASTLRSLSGRPPHSSP